MKFPDTNDIRYRCNDIDECRKSNDVEQERIARVNLVIMMTDIDEKTFKALNQLEQAIVDYIGYYNNKRIKVKLKYTKISSEEISDGRKYSLLFRYVKVGVSC